MNDQLRNSFASVAPPIVASPAKRIQAFTGDPDFMTSLARGLAELPLIPGTAIGTLVELAEATILADKVITF